MLQPRARTSALAAAEVELKSADWTLGAGHQLADQVGTNTSRSWADVPSGQTIGVTRARLQLDLQGTADDVAAEGRRRPTWTATCAPAPPSWRLSGGRSR